MSRAPTLQSLTDEVIAQVPSLCHTVAHKVQDELKSSPQQHLLYNALQRNRGRLGPDFEASLMPMLEAARRGLDPLQRNAPQSLDSLSLVDETQALQDVSIAHMVNATEDACRPELHQLTNFFAALRGISRPLKNDNPLRPALFAQALNRAVQGVDLDAEGRYALIKAATPPLVRGLEVVYQTLCQQLRAAELTPLVAGYGQGGRESEQRLRQVAAMNHTQPATLDTLAKRVDEYNSRPHRLSHPVGQSVAQGMGPAATPQQSGPDLLSRLYDQILADPRLLPTVKNQLARMQVPVARLAKTDASLLRRQDHPAWGLLNKVAGYGAAFKRADDERLRDFLDLVEQQIQRLVQAPLLTALQFQIAQTEVEEYIRRTASQRSERSAAALAALERESQRKQWGELLREQLEHQLADTALSPNLRKFLLKPWVEVIVQQMVLHGRESAEAGAAIELVDELLDSLQQRSSPGAIAALRTRLPGLIERLEQGMELIAFPPDKRQIILQDLMQQHGRVLRGLPAHSHPAPIAPATHARRDLSPEELLQQLLSERESQMPSRWAHDQVNRGELPTVPIQLYSEHGSPDARAALQHWMDALQVGGWYHMFVQSQWLTAQVAWISESRQFFLFVGQDADERHSLTRGAIEQLLANGLITALEEDTLVERAMSSLMQDLDERY